jgi:hypothetical protein
LWLSAAKGLGLANKGYVIGVGMTKFEKPCPDLGQHQDLPPRRSSMTLSTSHRRRLVGYLGVLGAQTQVDWQGNRYAIDGDPRIYNGSRRTAHVDYLIVCR